MILSGEGHQYADTIIYTEVSVGFNRIEEAEAALEQLEIRVLEIPREALFMAGKVFLNYRKTKDPMHLTLPYFFIGAHAMVSDFDLITRDVSKFKTHFPNLNLISPLTF